MVRLSIVVSAGMTIALSNGCGSNSVSQERQLNPSTLAASVILREPSSVGNNPADLGIQRDLKQAIAHDADLRARAIRFVVANGDVSVTGLVQTEDERTRINDLAMRISAVKSVANALRVAE
jgi:osmotically-inducible protein OsmY